MKTRILTGLVLAALFVSVLVWAPVPVFTSAILALAAWSYVEFDRLFFRVKSSSRPIRMVLLVCLSVLAIKHGKQSAWLAVWFCFVVYTFSQIIFWSNKTEFEGAVRAIALEWLGYTYVIALFGFVVPIVMLPHGRAYLFLLALIVFGGDTAAYFVGSRFGKHRLAPGLSPKKSWEGALGAMIAAVLVPFAWREWFAFFPVPDDVFYPIVLAAPVLSVLAQLADLFESLLKRSQSIKDSGSFLPGHGGILDRVDGLALSAPVFYFYLEHLLGAGS